MKKAIVKRIVEKHMRKYMRYCNKMMREVGIKIEFPTMELSSLDCAILDKTFNGDDGMCFCIDGNAFDAFSYNGFLHHKFGHEMEKELGEKGFIAEPWDQCHLDIVPSF